MKKHSGVKYSTVIGLVAAALLIAAGIFISLPSKRLSVSSYNYYPKWTDKSGVEYVGGDAYNYQMEASLKAGYVSGVMAMKAVFIGSGVILLCVTFFTMYRFSVMDRQTELLEQLAQTDVDTPAEK